MFLRQSTSQVIRFGPFVDDTDGVTAETGLTIAQGDMQISKDGAAFAQKNASGNATHDADGWYSTTLDTTDTDTVGEFLLQVVVSGALPVWVRYWVIEEGVYDGLIGASAAGFDASGYVAGVQGTLNTLDALDTAQDTQHSTTLTAVNALTDGILLDTTIAAVTTQTSFTLDAGSDQNDAYNGQSIVLYDASNSDYPCVRRVVDYTGSTQRVNLDTAPNFTIAASDGIKIFVSGAFASIKGATEVTDILVDDGSDPIEGVEVWITTGAAGTNTIWNGVTDALGVPKDVNDENPFLDPGTYYIWVQHSAYSGSNPTTLTVT